MGLLSDQYLQDLAKRSQTNQAAATSPGYPTQAATAQPAPPLSRNIMRQPNESRPDFFTRRSQVIIEDNQLPPEEQVKKFGGVVGSPEYYDYKAQQSPYGTLAKRLGPYAAPFAAAGAAVGGPIGFATGALVGTGIGAASYPVKEENWDSLTTAGKIQFLQNSGGQAVTNMVTALPKEITRGFVRPLLTIKDTWDALVKGDVALKDLDNKPVRNLPWLGQTETSYQMYGRERQTNGPLVAALTAGSTTVLDGILIGAVSKSLYKGVTQGFRPETAPGATGTTIQIKNVQPVRELVQRNPQGRAVGVKRQGEGAVSEYYPVESRQIANQFGGERGNTYYKVTKASPETAEVSVVQIRSGLKHQAVDRLTRRGELYDGDFGPEVKLYSETVQLGDEATQVVKSAAGVVDDVVAKPTTPSVPGAVIKGTENNPITTSQLDNLGQLAKFNELPGPLRDAVVRSTTGKRLMGELNQAEYVRAAQSLGMFSKAKQYLGEEFADPAKIRTYFSQYLSPQRRWMRAYEERGGARLYSQVYTKMEDAMRVVTVSDRYWFARMNEVAGDILKTGRSNQRNAIGRYIQGDKGAILDNELFTPAQKTDLVQKAQALDSLYQEAGPYLDVPKEIFLDNYLPRVQDRGGVFTLYKDGAEIPGSKIFSAKQKRVGSTEPLIEDPYALFQIYARGGSRAKFLTPVLEKVKPFVEGLPESVKGSTSSYVLERLGYVGKLEAAMDSIGRVAGRKLGVGLPEDIGRQFADAQMSGMYAGLMSQPATTGRNSFQYYLFGYGRLGDKFSAWAQKEVAKNPKAALKELADEGFSIDTTMPYGGAIASDGGSVAGDLFTKGVTGFKRGTQEILKPISVTDNLQRAVVYKQFKAQFDDAAIKLNQGKYDWARFEKEIGMKKFSPVDQQIARERIAAGDTRGAMDHLVRDVIDEIMFPYRKASSPRVAYGYSGKLGTALLSWPNEAAHMAGRWLKTKQWDNFVRYTAASTAIKRSMEEAFRIDLSSTLALGPFFPNSLMPPTVELAKNIFTSLVNFPGIRDANNGTRKAFNDANAEIVDSLQNNVPLSLFGENLASFDQAYREGADKDGLYNVRGEDGKVRYRTDFYGLYMGELVGFKTTERAATSDFSRDASNSREEVDQARDAMYRALQQGKYAESKEISERYSIEPTVEGLKQYDIPASERLIENLSPNLRRELLPRFQEVVDQERKLRAQP